MTMPVEKIREASEENALKNNLEKSPEMTTNTLSGAESSKALPQAILDEKITLLETVFRHIHKNRMADIPILNDRIEVSVIGFQQWQKSYLCILITPWFMNLMLLPGEEENWEDKQETTTSRHTFPSGNYEFLIGYEPDIGKYQMCSLFSPMFEFADNAAAVETAEIAIKELMNVENIEQADIDSRQLEAIWNGTEEHPDKTAAREAANRETAEKNKVQPHIPLKEKMQKPVSRRSLLRGALMLDEEKSGTEITTAAITENTDKDSNS